MQHDDGAMRARAAVPGDRARPRARCVHCGARLAATDATCPRCFDASPRAFAAGLSHVEIVELARPRRALRWLLGRHCPDASAREQRQIARQLAGVSLGPVRTLSFVDRRQAEALARQLEAAGARCQVVDEPRWPWGVIALFLAALIAVTAHLDRTGAYVAAYLLYFLSEPLLSLLRARQGLLASSRWPRSAWPGLQLRTGLLALILLCISDSLLARGLERLTFAGAFAALTGALLALATLASLLGPGRSAPRRGPEPPLGEQLRAALLWGRDWQRGIPTPRAHALPPRQGLLRAGALALVIGLVPLETAVLLGGGEPRERVHQVAAATDATSAPPLAAVAARAPALLPRARAGAALGALPLLGLGILALLLLRRTRWLRRQGDRLLATTRGDHGDDVLPWCVRVDRVPELARARAWLQAGPLPALAPRGHWSDARLRQWPLDLVADAPWSVAAPLLRAARAQGLPARAVYGWRASTPRCLRDASGDELVAWAALHALLVAGLALLALAAGARSQHLLLLPPLVSVLGLGLGRQLPRPSILRRRRDRKAT